MGEVYRPRDTRLKRDVAIKFLPSHLAEDPERVRRFEHEAETLAALNHPNIAAIHALEISNNVRNESGTSQVVVQPFPDPSGGKWQVSSTGGSHPTWRRDGKELYY